MATAASDTFRLDAVTPEPEDLETLAPNSAAPSPPQPYSLQSFMGPVDTLEEDLRTKLSQLISRANSKDSSTSEDESKLQSVERHKDKEGEVIEERVGKERQRTNDRLKDCPASEEPSKRAQQMNGQEMKRSEKLARKPSMRDEGRIRERNSGGLDRTADEQEQRGGHKREPCRLSKRQHKRDCERDSEQKRGARRSGSNASSPAVTPSSQEGAPSDNQVRTQGGTCRVETLCKRLISPYSPSSLLLCANHKLELLSSSLQQIFGGAP